MKIGYLGPKSSFTYTAAAKAFPEEELMPFPTIPACIKAVEHEEVTLAVVPIENSIEGSVNTTLDYLFHQSDLAVGAEIVLPIQQYLMVRGEHKKDWHHLEKIISHPQALAQCQHFIEDHFEKAVIEAAPSTTYGASYVAQHPAEMAGAIAPREAAASYGLEIAAENIQDLEINQTRFWVLGAERAAIDLPVTMEKMSLAITMPYNQPGSLHKALSAFGWREIDLSKIESRPLKTSLGEYFFLVDINIEKPIALIENALEEIRLLGGEIKIFGRYQVHPIKLEN